MKCLWRHPAKGCDNLIDRLAFYRGFACLCFW
jgi:hypothetical protein